MSGDGDARDAIEEFLLRIHAAALDRDPRKIQLTSLDSTGGAAPTHRSLPCTVSGVAEAAQWAVSESTKGRNVYFRPASFTGATGNGGSLRDEDVISIAWVWFDLDADGAADHGAAALADLGLAPRIVVTTGTTPNLRQHIYVALKAPTENIGAWREVAEALHWCVGGDNVMNPSRMMRLPHLTSYPKPDKIARGYIAETVTVEHRPDAPSASLLALRDRLGPGEPGSRTSGEEGAREAAKGNWFDTAEFYLGRRGRSNAELLELLERTKLEGQWHNSMRNAVATMVGRGYEDLAIDAMARTHGRVDNPPIDPEVQAFIDSARKKGWTPEPHEGPAEALELPRQFTPCPRLTAAERPRIEWLYDRFRRRQVAATVAAAGTGKTTFVVVEALAMTSGQPLLGVPVAAPLRVALVNLEDDLDDLYDHLAAAMKHFGLSHQDLGGRLFVDDGASFPITMAEQDRQTVIAKPETEHALIEAIRTAEIDILKVDPFVATHGVEENNNTGLEKVLAGYRRVARATGAAIELVHHTRKTYGAAPSVDDIRGASAIVGAVRWARMMAPMSTKEAEKAGVSPEEADDLVRVFDVKLNRAKKQPLRWFRKFGVALGNAGPDASPDNPDDIVGCIEPADIEFSDDDDGAPASPAPELDGGALAQLRAAVRDGNLREDQRAHRWWGHAIADAYSIPRSGLQWQREASRIADRLLRAGKFKVSEERDEHRHLRPFIRLPDYPDLANANLRQSGGAPVASPKGDWRTGATGANAPDERDSHPEVDGARAPGPARPSLAEPGREAGASDRDSDWREATQTGADAFDISEDERRKAIDRLSMK